MAAFLAPLPLSPQFFPRRCLTCVQPQKPAMTKMSVGRRMSDAYSKGHLHPVLDIIKRRYEKGSKPGQRDDGCKLALCIEGGGMRGAVSAGMIAAIRYCGLRDVFDAVYGCSAGAIVGAYFIADQVPVYGARIYYDVICAPHKRAPFIDMRALRHHPYINALFRRRRRETSSDNGHATYQRVSRHRKYRPVLLLDRLVDDVMTTNAPLDWDAFAARHAVQPLIPVAASLRRCTSHAFTDVQSLESLLQRVRASARVPGIAGDPVRIGDDVYADALLFEAIPFRSAIAHGATHVLVLRTRKHDAPLPTRAGIYESLIARPSLAQTEFLPEWRKIARYLEAAGHISTYRRDVDTLRDSDFSGGSIAGAPILSVVPRPDDVGIGQLEGNARRVFHAVRNGFAAGYDTLSLLVNDVTTDDGQTSGDKVARFVFPDEEIQDVERAHKEQKHQVKLTRRRARRMRKHRGLLGIFGRKRRINADDTTAIPQQPDRFESSESSGL